MKTFLYLLPIELDQRIKSHLRLIADVPMDCYSAPLKVDGKLVELVLQAERVETDQGLDARKLIIPEDKICVGIMIEHDEGENIRRTECDMFADHPVAPNAMAALAGRMDHIAEQIVPKEARPRNTTSYAWTYSSIPGYKVLRLCGQFK